MYVSVKPSDFTVGKLVCLGRTLRSRHPEWTRGTLAIFSSYGALKHYPPGGIIGDDGSATGYRRSVDSKAHFNAGYSFDTAKNSEFLEISPIGDEGTMTTENTAINLPLAGPPHCRLEVGGRCAMVLGAVEYPSRGPNPLGEATVTVKGTLKRDGSVRDVRVLDAKVSPVQAEGFFMKVVLQNVREWRVDEGARDEPFQVTFQFAIDNSWRKGPAVVWALPDHVLVRTRRSEAPAAR